MLYCAIGFRRSRAFLLLCSLSLSRCCFPLSVIQQQSGRSPLQESWVRAYARPVLSEIAEPPPVLTVSLFCFVYGYTSHFLLRGRFFFFSVVGAMLQGPPFRVFSCFFILHICFAGCSPFRSSPFFRFVLSRLFVFVFFFVFHFPLFVHIFVFCVFPHLFFFRRPF